MAPKTGDNVEGGFWDGAEYISVYTRAQAIDDGVLVDVSAEAGETGFKVPVALTRALFAKIDPPKRSHQDFRGRLHDVLWMLYAAIKRTDFDTVIHYRVKLGRELVTIKAISGPGDEGEHVLTLMLPEED
jgi:hypothetical protein